MTALLQLYYRHLTSARLHPDLGWHVNALENLMVDGMSSDESSSDESSIEDTARVYIILKKTWRSPAVTLRLRDIDSVHLSLRVTDTGRVIHGNWPHEHRDSGHASI